MGAKLEKSDCVDCVEPDGRCMRTGFLLGKIAKVMLIRALLCMGKSF
jgi:hypothetical protein